MRMPNDRVLILVYEYLWYREARLSDELEELRRHVKLVKHTPEDLLRLYEAEARYKNFKDFANELTKILENS